MMCQRIGLPPTSIMGLGLTCVSSLRREPNPPARMTAFIYCLERRPAPNRTLKIVLDVREGTAAGDSFALSVTDRSIAFSSEWSERPLPRLVRTPTTGPRLEARPKPAADD